MRKKILLISALAALIAVIVILILTSRPDARFDGDRISDPGRFSLRFERMNRTDSEAMALAEGDVVTGHRLRLMSAALFAVVSSVFLFHLIISHRLLLRRGNF